MWKIYSLDGCSYCELAKIMLLEHNIDFKEIKLKTIEEKRSFKAEGFKTVPQIFDDEGNHIGGYDELRKKIKY